MSCSKLKTFVAARTSSYPNDFVRLVNSVSDDATAQNLLEENEKSGILEPGSNFVLHTVLATRSFVRLGLIKPDESWLATSQSLLILMKVMKSLSMLATFAPKENLDPNKLFSWLFFDSDFQTDVQRLLVFLGD